MAAHDQALQQGWPFPRRSPASLPAGMVLRQLLLHLQPFLPADIPLMVPRLQDFPLLLHRRQRRAAVPAAPTMIGIGTSHGRVLQDPQDPLIGNRFPAHHTFGVVPHRQFHAPVPQQSPALAGRPGLPKRSEHLQNRPLHALVRVLADGLAAAHEAGRNPPVQRPAQRLVLPAALHPRPLHRQVRGRHGPLDALCRARCYVWQHAETAGNKPSFPKLHDIIFSVGIV